MENVIEMAERKIVDQDDEDEDDDTADHGDEDHGAEEGPLDRHARDATKGSSRRTTLWLILATASTLVGRMVLTAAFPYPLCYVFLMQLFAYLTVAATVAFLELKRIGRRPRECSSERDYTFVEELIIVVRYTASSFVLAYATICGAEALMLYPNLSVLCILPISTYIIDSLVSRLARCIRLSNVDYSSTTIGSCRLLFALFCILLVVYDDYRLNPRALLWAIGAFALISIDKLIPRIGRTMDNPSIHTWDCPLYIYLLIGVPPMFATATAAFLYEDVGSAFHLAWHWGVWKLLLYLTPGALLLIIFNSSMNMSYPFHPNGSPGTLEDDGPRANTAIAITLQAGFWTACLGTYLGEKNLVDWCQVIAFAILYVVGAGPREIAFYPPRLMNVIARIIRKPQLKIFDSPWQLPIFLWSTTAIFFALVSSMSLYFLTDVAYHRDAKTWTDLERASLDYLFIPPQPFLLDVVIAHSNGDSVQSIIDLISTFTATEGVRDQHARVKVYTKDESVNLTSIPELASAYTERLTAQALHNSGGVAATYLHYILFSWDLLPSQTLFLTTSSSSPSEISGIRTRFDDYFIPTLPIHSERHAEMVTSFLNLGSYSTCDCKSCADTTGWKDTFHLVPSMHGAAYNASMCESVLLTHGNNFVASADRIRGLGRDVWQMLYDALTNPDIAHAWSHDAGKVKGLGMEEIFGIEDSLEMPYLGYTIERLWTVLLQCSSREIAWRCPDGGRGWRRGGQRTDCSCLHW